MTSTKEYMKEYRRNNKDKIKEVNKQWRIENKEKLKEYTKKYNIENKEKLKEKNKQYKIDNEERLKKWRKEYHIKNFERDKEKNRERANQWYKDNREKALKAVKQYQKDNPEKSAKLRRKIENHKTKTDLRYNLNRRIKTAVSHSLKGNKNGRSWETLVGYTCNDLVKRLKSTMPKGYTWDDYLEGKLHVDHIIPKSVFNFTKPEHTDFKRCWDLSNLQLLPAKENLKKHTKLYKPFQPALAI